jgi:hypothetical protein
MNKAVFYFITITGILLMSLQSSAGQTLDQLLERHFRASGQERLSKVSTVITSGKAVQLDMEVPFKQIQKRPNMMYLELDIHGSKMIQAFNGVQGWSVEPWVTNQPRILAGPELSNLEEMASIDSDLFNWREKGHELEYIGREPSGDGEFFILRLIREQGEINLFFIDAGSYLIHKMVTSSNYGGTEVKGETIMTDYREIDGILVPFMIEMRMGGETLMTNIVEKIEYDALIEEKYFFPPANE